VINGIAYAPKGHPTTDFLVSMRVGSIEKTLRVRGNRTWEGPSGGSPSRAQPVTDVPVVYERAYGGYDHVDPDTTQHRIDLRNPVGCGVAARSSRRVGQPVPNFEFPHGDLETAGPAGFGAIDSFWSPRRELAGTYDKTWQETRLPLLPLDWDPRSLQCAPVDQRSETYLRGGEAVELVNLTRNGLLRFTLPKVYLVFTTYILKRTEEHRARVTTVTIEPDFPRVIMTWLTSLSCRSDVDELDVTVVREKQFTT
jgi:hypothetical protein